MTQKIAKLKQMGATGGIILRPVWLKRKYSMHAFIILMNLIVRLFTTKKCKVGHSYLDVLQCFLLVVLAEYLMQWNNPSESNMQYSAEMDLDAVCLVQTQTHLTYSQEPSHKG